MTPRRRAPATTHCWHSRRDSRPWPGARAVSRRRCPTPGRAAPVAPRRLPAGGASAARPTVRGSRTTRPVPLDAVARDVHPHDRPLTAGERVAGDLERARRHLGAVGGHQDVAVERHRAERDRARLEPVGDRLEVALRGLGQGAHAGQPLDAAGADVARHERPQRRAVVRRQRRAVHLPRQQDLARERLAQRDRDLVVVADQLDVRGHVGRARPRAGRRPARRRPSARCRSRRAPTGSRPGCRGPRAARPLRLPAHCSVATTSRRSKPRRSSSVSESGRSTSPSRVRRQTCPASSGGPCCARRTRRPA